MDKTLCISIQGGALSFHLRLEDAAAEGNTCLSRVIKVWIWLLHITAESQCDDLVFK